MKYLLCFLLFSFSFQVKACKCALRSPIELMRLYENIVEVEILSIKEEGIAKLVEVKVKENFKGKYKDQEIFFLKQGYTNCDMINFNIDERYFLLFNQKELDDITISKCSGSASSIDFEDYRQFLNYSDLINQRQILYFEQKGILFFKRYKELDKSIFEKYPSHNFYWAQKIPVSNIPVYEENVFDEIYEVKVAHAVMIRKKEYRPPRKLLRFIKRKSVEREKTLLELIQKH